jgi:hypothetical protein
MRYAIIHTNAELFQPFCLKLIQRVEGMRHRVNVLPIALHLDLTSFDHVILCGEMKANHIDPVLQEFLFRNEKLLTQKRVSLVLCINEANDTVHLLEKAFPHWLIDHALSRALCGNKAYEHMRGREVEDLILGLDEDGNILHLDDFLEEIAV